MKLPRIAFAGVLFALACGNSAPETTLLDRFFTASRYRDSATLDSISTVAFDKADQGVVGSFKVLSVSKEHSAPLRLKGLSAAVGQAREQMARERTIAHKSIHQGSAAFTTGDFIDVTAYDLTILSKDYTISADVMTPSNGRATKTLVVSLRRVILKGPFRPDPPNVTPAPGHAQPRTGGIDGKWVITEIRDATGHTAR